MADELTHIDPGMFVDPIEPAWDRWLPAPAKINLFLHVVGRRADGYHLLQTAFRFLSAGDRLRLSPRPDGCIERAAELAGVPAAQDLCLRAAHLLAQESGCKKGVCIELDKRMPMGGGLGGGSSDAATVLLALNRLWQLNLPRKRLQALGLRLGADVPVFVFGRSAFAEGVGEQLQALEPRPAWYVVIAPGVAVPTAEIFSAAELTRDTDPCKIADFSAGAQFPGFFGRNDLEPVARARYPEVDQALRWLARYAPARMSGSGSSVFAVFEKAQQAREVLASRPSQWQGFVAQGVDRHPLWSEGC